MAGDFEGTSTGIPIRTLEKSKLKWVVASQLVNSDTQQGISEWRLPERSIEYEYRRKEAIKVLQQEGFLEIYQRESANTTTLLSREQLDDNLTAVDQLEIVCDLDRFRKGRYNKDTLRDVWKAHNGKEGNIIPMLLRTFDGLNVFDKQHYNSKNPAENEAREMFYLPKNRQDTMNVSAAKRMKYHLGLWELNLVRFPDKYPTRDGSDDPDFIATSVYQLIYNPNYGDGLRTTRKDPLLVRWPDGKKRSISSDFFSKGWRFSGERKGARGLRSPLEFFYHSCPELTADFGGGTI